MAAPAGPSAYPDTVDGSTQAPQHQTMAIHGRSLLGTLRMPDPALRARTRIASDQMPNPAALHKASIDSFTLMPAASGSRSAR